MAELNIIPECFIDTNLIETLVPTPQGYNHQKGCNNVVGLMQKRMGDKFALGIVDKDKRQVGYLNEFEEIIHTESLFIYKHPSKPHFLILISPATDGFILKCAAETGINVTDFGLPGELKKFTSFTKQVTSKEDANFKHLFQSIKAARELKILKGWVKYLKDNTYGSKPKELKRIVEENCCDRD
ncbi:MAG: hypothetical protein LUI85_21945 [Bacteroides sp.]|nr:hypothetical protein [Bacteroides sp.]